MFPDPRLKITPGEDLALVQITDTHLFGDPSARLRGVASLPALRATLELARTDIAQSDAILLTGDLVQDDAAGYAHIRDVFAPLGRPVLTIAGNHDLKAPLRAALASAPFQIDGHHDRGAWRVVMLDSAVEGRAAGELAAAELQRLETALAEAGDRHVLICLHHHPVSLDSRWLDQVALQNARDFFGVVDRHRAVRGILFGHVHQAHDSLRGEVRVLGTPSTCAQFLPGSDRFQVDPRPPAYRHLVLRANGSIGTRLGWLAGVAPYSGTLTATSQNSLRA
jgi:Icc protein